MNQGSLFPEDEPQRQPKEVDSLPYAPGKETSRQTAIRHLQKSHTERAKVFQNFEKEGDHGVTDQEGMDVTGYEGNTYRPRRGELVTQGLVCASGERRKTRAGNKAIVWKLVKNEAQTA